MGWTICPKGEVGLSWAAHVRQLYTFARSDYASRVLDVERVGSTLYVLLEVTDGDRPTINTCVVMLTRGSPSRPGWGWKEMDETMGPAECACPKRILSRLSPVSQLPYGGGFARAWRDRCRAMARDEGRAA